MATFTITIPDDDVTVCMTQTTDLATPFQQMCTAYVLTLKQQALDQIIKGLSPNLDLLPFVQAAGLKPATVQQSPPSGP